MMIFQLLCLVILLAFAQVSSFFLSSPIVRNRQSSETIKMMFGGGKKASKSVVITVDGKTLNCGDAPVNLRKTLQANKIDVYPLLSKVTGLSHHRQMYFAITRIAHLLHVHSYTF